MEAMRERLVMRRMLSLANDPVIRPPVILP